MFKSLLIPFLLLWTPFLISAQVGTESSDSCVCSPPCAPIEGDCKHGRIIPREDCPCCKVCLRQQGDACDSVVSPCDTKLGLTCSSEGICQGNSQCKVDSDCPTDRFCVKDICADPCPLLQPCLGSLKGGKCITKDHQPRCECPKGTMPNHETNTCLNIEEHFTPPSPVSLPSNVGCEVDGYKKRVGEFFYTPDCSQRCECGQNEQISCSPISCPHGLFPSGSSKDQRFCIEIRNIPFADECCVVLACSSNSLQSIHAPSPKDGFERQPEPQALTARKVPERNNDEFISEFSYQKRLEELEAILNGNITLIRDNEQLDKDKHEALKRVDKSNVEPKVTIMPKEEPDVTTLNYEKEEQGIDTKPSTEASSSRTTFLLENHHMSKLHHKKITEGDDLELFESFTTKKSAHTPIPIFSLPLESDTETAPSLSTTEVTPSHSTTETAPSHSATVTAPSHSATETVPSHSATETAPSHSTTNINTHEESHIEFTTETTENILTTFPTPIEEDSKKGMIEEKFDNGSKHVNHPLVNSSNETFREGKEALFNEGGFKPAIHSEKEKESKLSMQQEKFSSKPGILQAKFSTHNSTTAVLPSKAGGVLHYKESRSDIEAMKLSIEEGRVEITVKGLTPNTKYTFKWAGNDGSSGKMETKTEDGCLHSSFSYPIGATWHEECQTTCSCHLGGVSECRPRCIFIAGAIEDEQCVEKPAASDPECCVEYDCEKKDNSVLDSSNAPSAIPAGNKEGEPKLIVTSRSHNSVTVAWDDFSADSPDRGYVTEYREVPSVELNTEIPWKKKETLRGQPPPTMTIDSLKPNTLYEVRVGIYSQAAERRLSAATETITVRTEPGCVYGNTSFPVGEFFQGCEERCSCAKDGSVKCSGRCTIPYFNKGSFANDPLCSEIQEDGDDCCVLVMCAHGGSSGVEDYDQCANTVCGKNAECVSWHGLSEVIEGPDHTLPQPGSCKCKDGFSGDPADHIIGCVADPSTEDNSHNCKFRLNSYSPGDVFYDGCAYKCTCNHQREIECQPRCQFAVNETMEETNNSCSFMPDPEDECCKIRVCNSTLDGVLSSVPSPSLDFNGCLYGNKTYEKNEEFTFGCDSKCLCMGFGDVSCYPRCPPAKEMPETKKGVICETLMDPEDECCEVIVCDNIAPEVMKENSTFDLMNENENATGAMNMEDEDMMHTTETEESKAMNKTFMEDDMLNRSENISGMDMNVSESFMNMTSNEGEMNVTTMEDMMDKMLNNSTNMSHIDHLNASEMEHADHSFNDSNMNNETLFGIHKHMNEFFAHETEDTTKDERDKQMFSHAFETEPEVTTMLDESINDGRMFLDRDEHMNESETLMKQPRFEDIMIPHLEIGSIVPIDSSSVKITLKVSHEVLAGLLSSSSEHLVVSYSHDSLKWTNKTIPVGSIDVENMYDIIFKVIDLEEFDAYQFKVYYKDIVSPITKVSLASAALADSEITPVAPHGVSMCSFKGKEYKPGENFYDGCVQYCECTDDMKVHCSMIECPERFGLDIMDPGCLEWEDDPTYVATPPRCCGQIPKCALHIDHLSCEHMGQKFQHLDFIPKDLVGCDQRCQCLSGHLDCENLCGPVTANPPFHLPCRSYHAKIVTAAEFPCCREWQCTNDTATDVDYETHPEVIPGTHFPLPPIAPEPELSLIDVTDITEHTIRIIFVIAEMFTGLPGGIYLRYTDEPVPDPNSLNWDSEIIHKDGVIMSSKNWDYVKKDLKAGTNYTMQLVLLTHLKRAETVSRKFTVSTLMEATTPLPRLDLDAELSVSEIMNTSAKISWKHFNKHELQYIDGIRVRFWPGNKKFPLEGPMLHREADNMILRDLDPDNNYTVDLFFIPHKGLTSTISNTKNITFRTLPKPKDKYAFNITIQPGKMTKTGIQIMYSGIPDPEGKFINVYRVVYTTDGDSQDSQKFKVPKTQKEGFIVLSDLKPGVQYEVWLEAYLTNGSKKKSNVITINTDPGELPTPEKSEIVETKELQSKEEESNYYSAFVTLAVFVAIACFIILGLIVLLMRRQNHAKAHINSSKAAYDNPSYKTSESPGYAMEMNGLKNTTNGASRSEEP